MFRVSNCGYKSRKALDGATHPATRFGVNPPSFRVGCSVVFAPRRLDMLSHVLKRLFVERCSAHWHVCAEVDNEPPNRTPPHILSIDPRSDDIAVIAPMRVRT